MAREAGTCSQTHRARRRPWCATARPRDRSHAPLELMLCSTALRAAAIWQSASCERALTCSSHPTADGMRFLIPRAMLSAPESSPPRHAEAQCGATPIDDFMARAAQWLCVARSPRLDCPPPGARQLANFGFSVASCSSCAREYAGVGADMEHVRRRRHSSTLPAIFDMRPNAGRCGVVFVRSMSI